MFCLVFCTIKYKTCYFALRLNKFCLIRRDKVIIRKRLRLKPCAKKKQIKKAFCNLIQNAFLLYPKFLLRQPYSREKVFVLFVKLGLYRDNNCSRTSRVVLKSTKVFDLGGRGTGGERDSRGRGEGSVGRRLRESRDDGLREEDFFSFM